MPETHGEYQRPQGWRFGPFEGSVTRNVPDAIAPTKYAAALNVRSTSSMALQTRPGYTLLFRTGGSAVTDMNAYSGIETDDQPRILARDTNNGIWLDDGTLVTTLTGAAGFGASMIPVRPPESPETWMYVASQEDYQKISPPGTITPTPTAQKVGIAEPPTISSVSAGVDAVAKTLEYTDFSGVAATWTAAGTAGATGNVGRVSDTAGQVFSLFNTQVAVQVTSTKEYQKGELLLFGGLYNVVVLDVLPAVGTGTIQAIRFDSGSSGSCTIVPSQLPLDQVSPVAGLGSVRRGALIQIGAEIVVVEGTAIGPDGTIAIYATTSSGHTAGEGLTGIPAILVDGTLPLVPGLSISGVGVSSAVTTGVGTLTRALSPSPFAETLSAGSSTSMPTEDDYVHFSLRIDDPTMLDEVRLQFNVDPSDTTFTQNVYTYAVQPSQLAQVISNTQTMLQAELQTIVQTTVPDGLNLPGQTAAGKTQWVEFMVPISQLQKLGDDQNATLVNAKSCQILVKCSGNVVVAFGSIWVGGGSAPDVGDDGADYMYRAVPRNSFTGATGNPTAPMRYGVRPRRQQVKVTIPDSTYDSQIDSWDFYRIGGSIDTYRYIGSAPTATGTAFFIDNYFDDAAAAGDPLESDNFEPWPSVDVPLSLTSSDATIVCTGTWIQVSGFSSWPATVDRWLPGTLIQIGAQSAYTLRSRPTQVASSTWLFEVEECISPTITPSFFNVLEPNVARQILPYLFGPDVNGTIFGCGDPLRPDVLSYTKPGQPDAVSNKNIIRLSQPSEPLLGGVIKGGVAVAASTKRFWALYPQAGGYNQIQQPVGRGLIAPYAICTDGENVYFWAKDCIARTGDAGYKDLINEDMYNLFPHEGVAGTDVTRLDLTAQGGTDGVTYYAPNYAMAGTFRLEVRNNYLFAHYQDTNNDYRTLVMNINTGGWITDDYFNPMTNGFLQQQQTGTLQSGETLYPLGLISSTNGIVYQESDCFGDAGNPIRCIVGTFEWDGGDPRSMDQWGDGYIDCEPRVPITITPVAFGQGIAPPTVVAASSNRQLSVVDMSGQLLEKFVGFKIEWSE